MDELAGHPGDSGALLAWRGWAEQSAGWASARRVANRLSKKGLSSALLGWAEAVQSAAEALDYGLIDKIVS